MPRHQQIRAVLMANGFIKQRFTPSQLEWLRRQGILPPVAGADGDDDADKDKDKDADKDADKDKDKDKNKPPEDKDKDKDQDKDKDSDKDSDKDKDKDDDLTRVPRSEYQRLKRIAKEAEDREKKAKEDAEKEKRKKAAEEGRWQEIVSEAEKERDAAFRERDEAKKELEQFKQSLMVEKVAKRLHFRDAADAVLFLDNEEKEDEKLAEAGLKRVLREKPYLKDERKATAAANGGGGDGGLTIEDVRKMSKEEINRRWDEVQKVMAGNQN